MLNKKDYLKVVVLLHTNSHKKKEKKLGDELPIDNYVVLFGKYISHELFSTVNCSSTRVYEENCHWKSVTYI